MKTQANFNDLVYIYDVLLYPFDDATPNAEKARQAAKFLQDERLSVKAALLECKKLERITDNNVWLG